MSFNFSVEQEFLEINEITIAKDARDNLLKVKIRNADSEYPIKPIRYFPFTGDEHYVGLFLSQPDGTIGREILLISDLKRLDENSRKLIEEELNKDYPLFKIIKIISIRQSGKALKWHVETMEGECVFEVLNENDISAIAPSIAVIKDICGNKYTVNPLKLDEKSRTCLSMYL